MAIPPRSELNIKATTGGGKLRNLSREDVMSSYEANFKTNQRTRYKSLIDADNKIYQAEADRSLGSRFLEELGITATSYARSVPRSFMAIGKGIESGSTDEQFVPSNDFEKFLYGEEPVSIKTQGEDLAPLLEKVGISQEWTKEYAVPIGLGMSFLDITPLGGGKGAALKRGSKVISKTKDVASIEAVLKNIVKGEPRDMNRLARHLVDVDDPIEVQRIITEGVDATKKAPSVTLPGAKTMALDARGKRFLGQEPPRRIVKTEVGLLKERIKTLNRIGEAEAKGAVRGGRESLASAKRIQSDIITLIKENLPVSLRGKLLTAVRDANKVSKLDGVLERVTKDFLKYEEAQELYTKLASRRSKQSFLKKIAELNQTAIRDIKGELGITKPIKAMDVGELDRMIAETQKRLEFKRERGLVGERVADKSPTRIVEEDLQEILSQKKTPKQRLKEGVKSVTSEVSGDFFKILSTELRAIDPSIRNALVEMERQASTKAFRGQEITERIVQKISKGKMSNEEYARLDFAFKNNAIDTINDIAKKYGFTEEITALRAEFDDILKRANEVDLEVMRRDNFFPRSLKSDKLSRAEATKVFNRDGLINEAFEDFQKKMGRMPNDLERWKIINNLVRGFRQQGVTLSKTGSLKSRVLDSVTPETNALYDDSLVSMRKYFETTNSLIEARRFFGKQLGSDLKLIDPDADLSGMVGVYVDKLIAQGKLTNPEEQLRLRSLLEARFTGGEMNKVLQKFKQIGYFTIMGDVFSALTQIGDLMPALYQAGWKSTATALMRNLLKRDSQALSLREFGLTRVAAEFKTEDGLAGAVDKVFKASGLTRIDALGKETFLNAVWDSYKARIGTDPRLMARIQDQMGELADATIADIKAGNITENVRQLMFSELSNFYPVTLSEVPVSYLRNPNGRIFYQMKTYTTKQLDLYRREIIQEMKTNPIQGIQNMTRMVGYLVVLNASAEEIKNFIKGKESDSLSDKVIDNFLRLFPFNRYTVEQAQQQGIGRTAAEFILPPTQVWDDAGRDIYDFVAGKDSPGLRVTRNIPVLGELYYWWVGRGATLNEKEQSSDSGSDEGIPTVELPQVEIPSVTLPSF